nr:hypothetical protein [Klebsiella michiganensis]
MYTKIKTLFFEKKRVKCCVTSALQNENSCYNRVIIDNVTHCNV